MRILSKRQVGFLKLFGKNELKDRFYLTGGTALAEFYVPYRLSEDLDFFARGEFELEPILVFLKSIKDDWGYESLDFNTSFNRNLIMVNFGDEVLKLEFAYFPFEPVEEPVERVGGVRVDSVVDIAVNKLFTIYQKPRGRDFMDLFMICKKYGFGIEDLIKKAKLKFDWHVDVLKLGGQFLLVNEVGDYPRLLVRVDDKEWKEFFEKEAKRLGERVLG